MGLQTYVSSFAKRTGTGTQVITGLGFRPKAVIFWGTPSGGTNFASGPMAFRFGIDDGTTHIGYGIAGGYFLGAYNYTHHGWSDTLSLCGVKNTAFGNWRVQGAIQSMDADGFTVNWSYDDGQGQNEIWEFLAIGGDGISAKVGYYQYSTAGVIPVTGVGFRPTGLIAWRAEGAFGTLEQPDVYGSPQVAFGTVSCGSSGVSHADGAAVNPSVSSGYQRTDKFIVNLSLGGVVVQESTLTSLDADGFTVTHANGGGGGYQPYLAIGGACVLNIGSFEQPSVTGLQTIPIIATSPKAVILASANKVASAVVTPSLKWSFGAADGTRQHFTYTGDLTGQGPNGKSLFVEGSDDIIQCRTPVGYGVGAGTLNSEAALDSMGSENFVLDWITVDATPRQIIYCVIAESSPFHACGGSVTPPGPPVTYQMRRLRRTPHVSTSQLQQFFSFFQLDLEAGLGPTDKAFDPQVGLSWSDDGGHTWIGPLWVSAGESGEYCRRAIWRQLGQARDRVWQLETSDPYAVRWLAVFIQTMLGNS